MPQLIQIDSTSRGTADGATAIIRFFLLLADWEEKIEDERGNQNEITIRECLSTDDLQSIRV